MVEVGRVNDVNCLQSLMQDGSRQLRGLVLEFPVETYFLREICVKTEDWLLVNMGVCVEIDGYFVWADLDGWHGWMVTKCGCVGK